MLRVRFVLMIVYRAPEEDSLEGLEYLDAAKDAYQFTEVEQVEPFERDMCFAPPGFCPGVVCLARRRYGQIEHPSICSSCLEKVVRATVPTPSGENISQTACQTLKRREWCKLGCSWFTRVRDGLPRDPCTSRTASVTGVSGTLPDSWVRGPHPLGTDTPLGRCGTQGLESHGRETITRLWERGCLVPRTEPFA